MDQSAQARPTERKRWGFWVALVHAAAASPVFIAHEDAGEEHSFRTKVSQSARAHGLKASVSKVVEGYVVRTTWQSA